VSVSSYGGASCPWRRAEAPSAAAQLSICLFQSFQFLPSTLRVTVIEVVEEVDIVDRQVGEVVFRDTRLSVANVSSSVATGRVSS
jgi:hypothetical protein